MWVVRLKLQHKDCPIVRRCTKFGITVFSYPCGWYYKKGFKMATTICFFQNSNEEKQQEFLADLKKDKRLTKFEQSENRFSYEIKLTKKGKHVMLHYTKNIFFAKPVMNHPSGYEYWEVIAWSKEELQEFARVLEKNMDFCEVEKLANEKLENVYFPNILPNLSKRQAEAFDLATSNGYYEYPKKITLKMLGAKAGISLTTFQEHLRKAEQKLLPLSTRISSGKKS